MEEIKAGDIMIGNYVMFENTTHIVTEISETLVATRWIKGNDKYIHELSDLRPIPLTEDILLKCGFIENYRSEYTVILEHSEHCSFEWKMKKAECRFCIWYKNMSIPNVIYLHQLQNLFKSLTGNDLKIEV